MLPDVGPAFVQNRPISAKSDRARPIVARVRPIRTMSAEVGMVPAMFWRGWAASCENRGELLLRDGTRFECDEMGGLHFFDRRSPAANRQSWDRISRRYVARIAACVSAAAESARARAAEEQRMTDRRIGPGPSLLHTT